MEQLLASEPGLQVVGVGGDGGTAWRLIEQLRPDVAVLDIEMPEADGIAIARRLQQCTSPTKVVLLTIHRDPALMQAAWAAGAWGYLLKENAAAELPGAIRSVSDGVRFTGKACGEFGGT